MTPAPSTISVLPDPCTRVFTLALRLSRVYGTVRPGAIVQRDTIELRRQKRAKVIWRSSHVGYGECLQPCLGGQDFDEVNLAGVDRR